LYAYGFFSIQPGLLGDGSSYSGGCYTSKDEFDKTLYDARTKLKEQAEQRGNALKKQAENMTQEQQMKIAMIVPVDDSGGDRPDAARTAGDRQTTGSDYRIGWHYRS
jgi:hypothetical protein